MNCILRLLGLGDRIHHGHFDLLPVSFYAHILKTDMALEHSLKLHQLFPNSERERERCFSAGNMVNSLCYPYLHS